jgi:tetratricopeptide (TPR) repeat protein
MMHRAAALSLLASVTLTSLSWAAEDRDENDAAAAETSISIDGLSPWQALGRAIDRAEDDPGAAQRILDTLLERNPAFLPARYNLGLLAMEHDQAKAAEHFVAATASANPDMAAKASWNLALIRHSQGRHREALAAAEAALRKRPEDPLFQQGRDQLRQHLLATQDALRLAREAEARRLRLDGKLPPARVGLSYEAIVNGAGGAGAPYRFAASELPAGLALGADGRFAGIPEKAGTEELNITIEDADAERALETIQLTIRGRPEITTEQLPVAVVGQSYEAHIAGQELFAATWDITGLPAGLSAQSGQGVRIVGMPTEAAAGTHLVDVIATDDDGAAASATFSLLVDPAFSPAEQQLEPATAWHAYQARLTVRGPAQRYRWSSTGASGLLVDEDGRVSGVPDQAGTLELPVTLSAEDGRSREATIAVPVNPPPVIDMPETITWQTGTAVAEVLKAEGGTPPLNWRIDGVEPPPGVSLVGDRFTGSPNVVGTWEIPVVLTDRWGALATRTLAIEVEENDEGRPDGQDEEQQQDGEQSQDGQQQDGEQGDNDQQQDGEQNQDGDQSQDGQQQDGDQGQDGQQQDGEQGQDGNQNQDGQQQDSQGDQGDQTAQGGNDGNQENGDRSGEQRRSGLARSDAQRWLEQVLDGEEDGSRRALQGLVRGAAGPGPTPEQPW